jgi:hypothetical protein
MIWGRSLAPTREALEVLDLGTTLDREVIDDGPMARRIAETKLRLLTRRALRVLTPLDGSWRELWAMGRRQGQFLRLYYPRLWCWAGLLATADLLARVMLAWDLLAAGSMPALIVLVVVAALGSIATELRRAVGRGIGAVDAPVGVARPRLNAATPRFSFVARSREMPLSACWCVETRQ